MSNSKERQRFLSVGSHIDHVTDPLQHRGHQVANGSVVVDHRNPRHSVAKFLRLAISLSTSRTAPRL